MLTGIVPRKLGIFSLDNQICTLAQKYASFLATRHANTAFGLLHGTGSVDPVLTLPTNPFQKTPIGSNRDVA